MFLIRSRLIEIFYNTCRSYSDFGFSIYFADECISSGLVCIPLQQCPQLNQIAIKIQELGNHENTIQKLELLNKINNQLCGGRIKKELHVCCEQVAEIDTLEEIPSSIADHSDKGFVPMYLAFSRYFSLFGLIIIC